jgi:UDPglucose--hexose-1-phosphate uridylyltransferase
MPEIRRDPIFDRWVIFSKERAARPYDFQEGAAPRPHGRCDFCEGHEAQTPPETFAVRESGSPANGPGWRVRVVPNKYPALRSGESAECHSHGLFSFMVGAGVHEVIIESPRHLVRLSELADEQLVEVFTVYRDRLAALRLDPRIRSGILFKNVGRDAGASLEHVHSQLVGLPLVPPAVQAACETSRDYYLRTGETIWSRLIAEEIAADIRVVQVTPGFLVICPFASRFSFETWILPRRPHARFDEIAPDELAELARLVQDVTQRIERAVEKSSYNLVFHTAPFDGNLAGHYQWHVEILPRIARTAGFEWGSGCFINSTLPEEAARTLRTAKP